MYEYSSLANHLFHFGHFAVAFALLFLLAPRILFSPVSVDKGEAFFANFIRIAVLLILAGYVLVAVKLFEVLGILAVLLAAAFWRLGRAGYALDESASFWRARFYDLLEIGFRLKRLPEKLTGRNALFQAVKEQRQRLRTAGRSRRDRGWLHRTGWLLLAAVIGISAYLRFSDTWLHAAPPLSDSYVTLEWMKLINRRLLFAGGVYPQGTHILLACLHKFAAIDQLYVLRYLGPLSTVLTVYGLYVAVSRLSGSAAGGLAAAAIFGIGGSLILGSEWERQAATNSQEFGYLFVLPILYFTYRYLAAGERRYYVIMASGYSLLALVHPIAYVFGVMEAVVASVVFLALAFRSSWVRVLRLAAAGVVSALLAYMPVAYEKLMGKQLHDSSEKFLKSKIDIPPAPLHLWDWVGVASILALAIYGLIRIRDKEQRLIAFCSAALGMSAFAVYEWGAYLTHSLVVSVRSGGIWALDLSFSLGMAVSLVFRPLHRFRWSGWAERILALLFVAVLCWITRLQPVAPYKMQRDEEVEQMLRINAERRPMTWTIFTSHVQGYSIALGNGYHHYIEFLYENYDPEKPYLTRKNSDTRDNRVTDEMFVFYEKKIFEVSPANSVYSILKEDYDRRRPMLPLLKEWLDIYRQYHAGVDIYYEDEHLVVYRLYRENARQMGRIWGETGNGGE